MRAKLRLLPILGSAMFLHCGDDSAPSAADASARGDGGASSDARRQDARSAPDAPRILSFSTNVTSITEDESVTFTGVVTDPDGIDDLIGGTLASAGITLGSFSTAAQEGAYTLTLSWSQMNQADPIHLENEATRVFVATFYDVAGHEASQETTIRLHCGETPSLACEGTCFPVTGVGPSSGSCDTYCESLGNGLECAGVSLYEAPPTCTEDYQSFSCSASLSTVPAGQHYSCTCTQ